MGFSMVGLSAMLLLVQHAANARFSNWAFQSRRKVLSPLSCRDGLFQSNLEIEPARVHDLGPSRHKIGHEFLYVVVSGIEYYIETLQTE